MTTNTITFSSELMTNYMQAEIMAPQAKFEALQTSTGLSLLFSVGTDNVFYVTQETHGVSSTGWTKTDLSSAQIAKDFSGKTGITCVTFAVAQNVADGTIGAAMVVNDTQNDHLYLCLGNSNSDASWLTQPVWVAYPYDNSQVPAPSAISIANVFISETSSGQYIVADIVQNPASPEKLISRYYIDPKKTEGCAWNVHNLTIDLQAGNYSTCLGRQHGQPIDGLYTIGQVGGSPQFTYQPLYNAFDQAVAANPCRLVLPGNLTAQAIASCRNSDQSTDLYVMANGGLYYFASSNQADSAQGVLLFENSLFSGVSHLFAYSTGTQVYIWGLNQADQVFYATCPIGQINTAGAWSYPLPILSGVDLISPYVNCANNGNTFFAVGGSTLYKMVQSPTTGLWASQSITLPPPAVNTPAQSFSSYTTRIQLADSNNQPVAKSPLLLSAASCGSFFINNLYYVLDTTPIPINTDMAGSITIIECVSNLQGTQLTVAAQGGNPVAINPMDKPFNKAVQLNSVSSLQSAVITNPDGSTQALIASGASPTDLGSLALSNQRLAAVYANVSSPTKTPAATAAPASAPQGIAADAGDIFKWLESGVEAEISIVEDAASGLWHFIANIAGQAYYGVLDCAEKVVGAVQWLFNAIKTAIGDLIKYLQFLFDWQDITRTKQVVENLINLFIQNQINGLSTLQSEFDGMIASAQTAINNWAGITDWTGLGSSATASLAAGSNPVQNQSASTTMLSHHFQNNASNLSTTSALPNAPSTQSVLTTFLQALGNEEKALDGVLTQFQDLAGEYSALTLSQVLEKIVAILADGVLDSAKVVMDALFEVLIDLAAGALEILNMQIYIPVVSDILSDFGVPSFSFLDLFCWIAAVPVTIVYKIANNAAPFLDDANTGFLISATDYQTVVNTLNPAQNAASSTQAVTLVSMPAQSSGSTTLSQSATPAVVNKPPIPGNQTELIASSSSGASSAAPSTPSTLAKIVSCCAHLDAGAFYTVLGIISPMEAVIPSGPENAMSTPVTIMSICASVCQTIGNDVDPQYPIQSLPINELRYGTLCLRTMFKLVYSASFQRWLSGGENPLPGQDYRATSAVIDNILVIPAAVCSVWHFYELSKDPAGDERSAAIIGEIGNVTNYLSRISYAVAVNSDSPDALTALWLFNWCTAGLQAAEAVVEVV